MKLTKIALTCGLVLAIGSASAAGAMQYKSGFGVSFTSGNDIGLNYYFGHDNTNVVTLNVGYYHNDHNAPGLVPGQQFTDDATQFPVSIAATHLFALNQANNLFFGTGLAYTKHLGSAKVNGVSEDNESWNSALILGLQYRLSPQFYLDAGTAAYTYGFFKFKNSDAQTINTSFGHTYVGATYLF